MLSRFKNAIYNVVTNLDQNQSTFGNRSDSSVATINESQQSNGPQLKFRYSRPLFLQLSSDDEILVSADHIIRPIIVPRDITKLPFNSGYAEYFMIQIIIFSFFKTNLIYFLFFFVETEQ
jgi:protein phosphatase 1H